jgi:hypothetical protein
MSAVVDVPEPWWRPVDDAEDPLLLPGVPDASLSEVEAWVVVLPPLVDGSPAEVEGEVPPVLDMDPPVPVWTAPLDELAADPGARDEPLLQPRSASATRSAAGGARTARRTCMRAAPV